MLRIFDTTKLKNSQRNCPSLGWGRAGSAAFCPPGTQCSQRDQYLRAAQWTGWATSLVSGFKQRGPTMAILFSASQKNKAREYATHD